MNAALSAPCQSKCCFRGFLPYKEWENTNILNSFRYDVVTLNDVLSLSFQESSHEFKLTAVFRREWQRGREKRARQ